MYQLIKEEIDITHNPSIVLGKYHNISINARIEGPINENESVNCNL